jgi:hypothetical protein
MKREVQGLLSKDGEEGRQCLIKREVKAPLSKDGEEGRQSV